MTFLAWLSTPSYATARTYYYQLQEEEVLVRILCLLCLCAELLLTNPSLVKLTRTGSPIEVGSLREVHHSERG